ncbi:hypothetical protein CAP35_12615 [Chitinophagaceae bacterium IBVUCB1]|nr:hypothetical protein CAP35_12615 [Chitinophagaceae bacterium IBVUCB1]
MMASVINMLNSNGYDAIGATTDADAINQFNTTLPDAVIIGGGVEPASRAMFHQQFADIKKGVPIIDAHPHTLLQALQAALSE